MTDDEVYSLEKQCRRGEVVLVNPKDWRIYDIFLEDDDNTVTIHRCIDSKTHEDKSVWSGNLEEIALGEWNQIFFNKELTLFVYEERRNNINYE